MEAAAWVDFETYEPVKKFARHPAGLGEDCGQGNHFWHLLWEDPKFSAYCSRCPKRRRRGKRPSP